MAANVFDPLREHPGLLFELFTFKRSYDLDRDTDYESDQEEAFLNSENDANDDRETDDDDGESD